MCVVSLAQLICRKCVIQRDTATSRRSRVNFARGTLPDQVQGRCAAELAGQPELVSARKEHDPASRSGATAFSTSRCSEVAVRGHR